MSFLSKRASMAEQEIQRLFLYIIPGTTFEKKVFSVGGYERDALMGKESKDLDIVVEMKGGAEQLAHFVKHMFPEETTTPRQLGAAYPIWHIGFKEDVTHKDELFKTKGGEIDIADTQKETYPDPTSRQRATEFATLPEDVQRRDFTVNMLLRDLSSGEIVDLTGSSKGDIEKGILRGHPQVSPDKMFSEDPLRMMRLIRFQVKYGWDIPLSMLRAVRRNAEQIQKISWERIQEELIKMMKLGKTDRAIQLMKVTGLLNYVLPEVYGLIGIKHDPSNHQEGDVYKHTLLVLSNAPPTVVGQLSALLHDIGKPQSLEFIDGKIRFFGHEKVSGEIAEAVLRRLKFDNGIIKTVRKIVENHMRPIALPAASPKALRKFVRDIGDEIVEAVLELAEADALGTLPPKNYVPELRSKLEESQKIPIAKVSILNGEEIMGLLGIKPGPKIKEVMTYLKELEDEFAEKGEILTKETATQKIMERFGPMKSANRFQLSKRAMQVIIEPLDPAVQAAVQEVQRIAPDTLMKVKKVVVHPSGGAGELGHVQMGPDKDPHEIHIFKSRIEQIAKQQLGASGGQIDPKQLAEAVKMALIETISHEGAHIGGAKRSEEQIGKGPFFGEGEAEAKAKEVMQREKQLMPKPAQTRFSLSKRAMKITREMIPTLWYEDEAGKKHILSENELKYLEPPPEGFIYQHSQFPTTLNHTVLRLTVADEVESCSHPEKYVRPTYGWIDGVEGRECVQCYGHQTRNIGEPWSQKWDAGGSKSIMTGSSGWSEDLALAMVDSGDWTLKEAILIAANSCERCMNALAHKYGLKWGYPEFSEKWKKCGTICEFCEADPKSKSAHKKLPLSKRATLERLPIAADPAMWTDEQLFEAISRPELFKGDKERFQLAVEQAAKRGLTKKVEPKNIGEWRKHGWWLLMWAGIPLAFYDNDAKINMAKRLLVEDFAKDGTQPEAVKIYDSVRSSLKWALDEMADLEPPDSHEQADLRKHQLSMDVDEIMKHPLYGKRRKGYAESALNIFKTPAGFEPPKESVPSGSRPVRSNSDAASEAITDMRYGEIKPEFTDAIVYSQEAAGDAADELVSDAAKKLEKEEAALKAGIDISKMNDDRAYASFISVPISKRAFKKKRLDEIILEAALALDAIRERHLPNAPMAEPDLRFAIKMAHASPDLVRFGLELLKDEQLHPISADIENAIEFNKTAISNPNIAKLLGIVSNQLNFADFGNPDFITELAEWQNKHNMTPNGKLDASTIAAFATMKPKVETELPRNFGVVIPGLVYRGGIIEKAEQLENLKNSFGVQRLISLHDNPDMARMCGLFGIQHVPAFMSNGNPEELGRKVLGDSVLNFIGDIPTYIHCFYGADRASSVVARIRTESGWPCQLAYAEAKAYGFKDMFADLIDWFSEPCKQKLNIDTDAIRKRMGDRKPYSNPEISQDLVEPAPTDLPFETSNSGWETTSDTIVNTFGIGSIPISDSSHGW